MPADEMTTAKRLREMRAYINTHPDLSRYCQLLEQAAIELESLNGPEGEAASQLERELAAAKYNESVFRALHLDSEKRLETSITPSHVGDSGDWWSQFDDAYAKAGKTGDPLDWMNAAVAAANARRFTPSPVEPREPVWLIERGQAEGQSPTIWHTGEEQPRTMQAYLGQWTEEAHRAAKFPTKGQAEHWAETMGRLINYRVTEHIFLDRPTLTPSSNGEGTTYVPGLWRCAKCKLDLIHTNLHVYSGTTSPNNDPQPCPNGCGPMWRVSEADYRKELLAQVGKLFDEVQSLRSHVALDRDTFIEELALDAEHAEAAAEVHGLRILELKRLAFRIRSLKSAAPQERPLNTNGGHEADDRGDVARGEAPRVPAVAAPLTPSAKPSHAASMIDSSAQQSSNQSRGNKPDKTPRTEMVKFHGDCHKARFIHSTERRNTE